jgi:hypothetical protein
MPMGPAFVRFITLASVAFAATTVQAQQATPSLALDARAQVRDSVGALREARAAQAEFERLRLRSLPWTADPGGGWCDERIGRFCLTYGDREDEWTPPPERPAVTRGRAALIERLEGAAARVPGDEWVAGQRVRYLVEAGRAAEAAAAARACRARGWWCRALEGYALHAVGEYGAADAAFTAALAAMPDEERRRWLDLSPVLEGGDARALRRMDPAAREAAVRRLWWLADPLWMLPGNDQKTEHFSRLVVDQLQERARTTEGFFWAADLREILLRFGEPVGWERIRPPPGSSGGAEVLTHYAPRSWDFLPTVRMAADPAAIRPDDWTLDERAARTGYAPDSVARLEPLEHQLAVFRRAGAAVVVAGFALDPDSLPPGPDLHAALVLAADEDAAPLAAPAAVDGARGSVRLDAPAEPTVLSLEARERKSRHAARARYGVDLRRAAAPGLALSDVLLLADPEARPASLDEAAPLVRPSARAKAGERLGLYWEVYGLEGRTDTLTVSVSLARKGRGGGRSPVRIRWRGEADGSAVMARSLGLALPNLRPGPYLLEVSVHAGGASATSVREITVER